MRTVTLFVMKPDKTTAWITIPWGKKHLDWYRNNGYIILLSV